MSQSTTIYIQSYFLTFKQWCSYIWGGGGDAKMWDRDDEDWTTQDKGQMVILKKKAIVHQRDGHGDGGGQGGWRGGGREVGYHHWILRMMSTGWTTQIRGRLVILKKSNCPSEPTLLQSSDGWLAKSKLSPLFWWNHFQNNMFCCCFKP